MAKQASGSTSKKRKLVDSLPKSKSACKRCRTKKIKCDQELPSCKNCSKVNEPCVSLDTATGEDVPRSYMLFLEDRVTAMARKLEECGVDLASIRFNIPAMGTDKPYDAEYGRQMNDGDYPIDTILGNYLIQRGKILKGEATGTDMTSNQVLKVERASKDNNINKNLQNNSTGKELPDTSPAIMETSGDSQFDILQPNKDIAQFQEMDSNSPASFLGDSSGISFAKLVFTAANFSPDSIYNELDVDIERREKKLTQYKLAETTKDFDPIWLPPRHKAEEMIIKYFTDTNSQLPILHREFFLKKYFEPIYGSWNTEISLTSDHTVINTNFELPNDAYITPDSRKDKEMNLKRPWFDTLTELYSFQKRLDISVPAKFKIPLFFLNAIFAIGHATQVLKSDIKKLVTFKRRALQYRSALFNSTDKLEVLSGSLLIVLYSLMRPNTPGLWYVLGSVLRLTVDLGLHDEKLNQNYNAFQREIRRRLFWCTYSLDRQICSYFGRPFGIPEESITTRFPSLLDDSKIVTTPTTTDDYSDNISFTASSKIIATAMYKVRRIQGNIVKVLYAPRAELPKQYSTLNDWKEAVLAELDHWYKEEVPKSFDSMNCKFNTFFFDLNYHYSKTILFGLSPKCPALSERAFNIVKDSTKGTIDVFDGLCSTKKLSYTWVATHNMFMTGMTYLYVIYYYSGDKMNNDSDNEVVAYTGKVLNVLKNLIGTCEAAKNCYKTYKMLCAAVIKLRFGTVYAPNGPNTVKRGKNKKPVVKKERKETSESNLNIVTKFESSSVSSSSNDFGNETRNQGFANEKSSTGLDPLDQFFNELGKVDDFIDQVDTVGVPPQQSHLQSQLNNNSWDQVTYPHTTLEENNNTAYTGESMPSMYQSISTNNIPDTWNQSQQRRSTITMDKDIGDLLYQVTSQSMWDELFGNQTGSNEASNSQLNSITNSPHQDGTPSQSTPDFGNMGLF
ncbi:Fungal specific transcription factor [Monosporozyma unispora]|nr:Fungal specific transcription factor [Kazachstania unispora]